MSLVTKPYKGARDFYPKEMRLQKWMFARMREVVEKFGYEEYNAPLLEPLELYAAKTGDEIVSEQTYQFEDRGGRKVVIRPEMTPSVSRMVADKRQELAYPLRLYNIGNRWRYERPQKGRLREFWQMDVDIFGVDGVEAEVEMIQLVDQIMKNFGAKEDMYEIRINSRVMLDIKVRASGPKKDIKEIMAFLDKKNKMSDEEFSDGIAEMFTHPGAMQEWLRSTAQGDMGGDIFDFKQRLEALDITNVVIDPSIIRGFDYYTDIVFEVFDKNPDNNRSLFGGGRYSGLVELFGVDSLEAIGFAIGDVPMLNFLEGNKLIPKLEPETDVYVVLIGDVFDDAQQVISQLRSQNLNLAVDFSGRKAEKQIKSADKKGVTYVAFIGEQELNDNKLRLKNLQTGDEQTVDASEVAKLVARTKA